MKKKSQKQSKQKSKLRPKAKADTKKTKVEDKLKTEKAQRQPLGLNPVYHKGQVRSPMVDNSLYNSPIVGSPWTTMDNSKEDESIVSSKAVLKNIEHMLDREGLFPAYLEAVKASGGDSCTWENKLKVAGYIYYGGVPGRDGRTALVKKPMSLIKDSEKVDEIREDVTKAWGDVKIRPERRPLLTEEIYKKWRDRIYPAPHQTAKNPKSFSELSLDDRISWAHTYMSKYHEMRAESKPLATCILTSMEFTCKQTGIPIFVGADRDPQFIEFITEECAGITPMGGLLDAIRDIEESQPAEYVKHDAKCEVIDYAKALKLLMPTLKVMKLVEIYKEYVSMVEKTRGLTLKNEIDIANYLISCGKLGGFNVDKIPQCLINATDGTVKKADEREGSEESFGDKLESLKKIDTVGFLPPDWGKMNTAVKAHQMAGPKVNQRIEVKVDGKPIGIVFSSMFSTYSDKKVTYHKEIEAKGMSLLEEKGFNGNSVKKTIIAPDKFINFVGCKKKK